MKNVVSPKNVLAFYFQLFVQSAFVITFVWVHDIKPRYKPAARRVILNSLQYLPLGGIAYHLSGCIKNTAGEATINTDIFTPDGFS